MLYATFKTQDAKTYDLCLNSGVIGIDRCVRILTDIYDAKSSEG